MQLSRLHRLSIIIPVYNEGNTIHLILDKIRDTILPQGTQKDIIIASDCSTDRTSILKYGLFKF